MRLHVRVRVRALDWNPKLSSRLDVARGVETAEVRVPTRAHTSIHPLRPSQPKLEQHRVLPRHKSMPRRVRRQQTGVVDETQQRRLEQLHRRERSLETQQRHPREHHRPFLLRVYPHLARVESEEKLEELILHVLPHGRRFQVLHVPLRKLKVAHESQRLLQPREHGELALERVRSKEQLEHRASVVRAVPPVRVRHRELVRIREQRRHEGVLTPTQTTRPGVEHGASRARARATRPATIVSLVRARGLAVSRRRRRDVRPRAPAARHNRALDVDMGLDARDADASEAPHTGTTIVACEYAGGVVLGADSRVSTGANARERFERRPRRLTRRRRDRARRLTTTRRRRRSRRARRDIRLEPGVG